MTAHFCSSHPFLALYLSGAAAYFILNSAGIIWRYINRDSVLNRNLHLIGLEVSVSEGHTAPTSEGKTGFLAGLPHVGSLLLTYNFGALLSWLLVLIQVAEWVISGYRRLKTPPALRELLRQARQVPFSRGEDFLELRQRIFSAASPDSANQTLADIQKKAEYLTRCYARRAFADLEKPDLLPEESAIAGKYLELAKKLSRDEYKTEIVHPSFWKIPATRAAAEEAVKARLA